MRTTEQDSLHSNLEQKSIADLVHGINTEDQKVAHAVGKQISSITAFIEDLVPRMEQGGRLFYIGAGTSGRLGILDASECPPTFGVSHDMVIGLIAGGDSAIRKAVENAEDCTTGAWNDLQAYEINSLDTVVGIAASGTTPYVIGGIEAANKYGLLTGCITCNAGSPLGMAAQHEIAVVVGPEFLTGSTRMKSGTAQKMVLNMITTATMIKLGRVKGNKMVDMQLSNDKLVDRGTRMVAEELDIENELAQELLLKHGSVRAAVDSYNNERK
jgi:N-acetylmuramic acid 6-phosphate etherase